MADNRQDFSKFGFVKTVVLPALLLFLTPILGYLFFWHAQSTYDAEARKGTLAQIRGDANLTPEDRKQAEEFFSSVPFSTLILNEEFAAGVDGQVLFDYAVFRWMLRLSAFSILSGVGVVVLAGACVLLSLRSHKAQYLSLSTGWHVLRLYTALQVAIQGVLIFALSYWVTALWFQVFIPKLMIIAAIIVIGAICVVVAAIFKTSRNDVELEGEVIDAGRAGRLWQELSSVCGQVGTAPPDQIVAGIDDNFFVTEQPLKVNGQMYQGRTLYVSLSLLKHLSGNEAKAVMAHEMAHFSGQDTTYSKKIAPLLMRFDTYLGGLYEGGVSRPIFYFMLFFRNLYELSLGKTSREREFRADRIAAEATSPRDMSVALLRIIAYSKYRHSIEQEMFKQEQAHESANIGQRVEQGFPIFASSFASKDDIGNLTTSHPFDSHPPVEQRLAAVGEALSASYVDTVLANVGDGAWFRHINDGDQLERKLWTAYEDRFRQFHEEVLAYRYLPSNEQEKEIVVKYFPPVTIVGKAGTLEIDFERMVYPNWDQPIRFDNVSKFELNDSRVLQIYCRDLPKKMASIKLKSFGNQQQVIDAINYYYSRHVASRQYQEQKKDPVEEA